MKCPQPLRAIAHPAGCITMFISIAEASTVMAPSSAAGTAASPQRPPRPDPATTACQEQPVPSPARSVLAAWPLPSCPLAQVPHGSQVPHGNIQRLDGLQRDGDLPADQGLMQHAPAHNSHPFDGDLKYPVLAFPRDRHLKVNLDAEGREAIVAPPQAQGEEVLFS